MSTMALYKQRGLTFDANFTVTLPTQQYVNLHTTFQENLDIHNFWPQHQKEYHTSILQLFT